MDKITYQTILRLIHNINSFAEQSDQKIQQLWDNFNNSKRRLEEQYNQFMTKASAEHDSGANFTEKKATALRENANKIYQEVLKLDTSLAATDKYYVKMRVQKTEELAQKTEKNITDTEDVFIALEQVKKQYMSVAEKYKETLPAIINGVNFIFSKQRKQDYEELIVLKNTLEKLIEEINETIPELAKDSVQANKDNYVKKTDEIKSKYKTELTRVSERYKENVEALADKICEQLDAILPDNLLHSLEELNDRHPKIFSGITPNFNSWDETIIIGQIDYPLELYVTSKILFSLIKNKCVTIVAQNKLLRFPLVFSLNNDLNILIKYTEDENLKNKFMKSIMQNFIASVPVAHLTLYVIDSESQGENTRSFAELYKELPDLFNGGIITSKEKVEDTLEKLTITETTVARSEFDTQNQDIRVLIIFDPPESLGNKNMALVNQIIKNGSNCGVYTIMSYNPATIGQNGNTLTPYHEKSIVIQQAVDIFLYYELHIIFNEAFEGNMASRYARNYLLFHECLKDNFPLLDSSVQKLVGNEEIGNIYTVISSIKNKLDDYSSTMGAVPSNTHIFPTAITVGTLLYPLGLIGNEEIHEQLKAELAVQNTDTFKLSALFNLSRKNNLFLICPEANRQYMEKFVHGFMWNVLSSIPVSKINFCIFDAERKGNSITPFLDFRQKLTEIFDGQIYTTQDAMISRLQKINVYIDEFIQNKLGNRFDNIIEYNTNTPNRTETITLLIIFDFPRNFDNRSIDLLLDILNNGSKCGIYTIICYNPNIIFSKYESIDGHLAGIRNHCSMIDFIEKNYTIQPYGIPIIIAEELPKDNIYSFMEEYIKASEALKHKSLSFEDILNQPFFSATTRKRLSIPVGIGDGENIVNLILGEGSSHHGIIAGATGSGKSSLLHTIIMSGMLSHSPDELHFYLMDFKSGTEFKVYESVKVPHIQLLALDAMQEFGESILENLVAEMLHRGNLFKDAGQTSLAGYIEHTEKSLPRILVIMDEFQVLFNDSFNRKIATNCAELTKRIVTEGRAFGIHLLMATQTTKVISELTLSHGIVEQMRIRIGLKCGEDDVRYLYGGRNEARILEMMKGPIGTAIMNLEYMESSNIGFRSVYCSKEMQAKYLSIISETYRDIPSKVHIFEGNRTILFVDYLFQNEISTTNEPVVKIHIGTLIKVAPPFVLQFDRRRRCNLLICGANEKMSENLTSLCIFSALLNTNTDVYCIDSESLICEAGSSALYDCLGSCFASRFKLAKNRSEIIGFINDLYSIYLERKKASEMRQTLIVIKNIQFLDIIKKMFKGESLDETEYLDNSTHEPTPQFADFGVSRGYDTMSFSVTEKLLQLIDNGANYGMFFIVSSLEYQCVKETMYYGENILSKFPERIICELNNNDADNLINGVAVSGLKDNTVYYSDGVKNVFQVKPYTIPDILELNNYIDKLFADGKVK